MFGKTPRQLLLFTLLALSYPSLILASPAPSSSSFSNMVVQDSRDEVPQGFVATGPVPSDQTINIRIAMVSNDMAGLEERLYAVSTPNSAEYGNHLSKEEVESFVKPTADSVSKLNSWLESNGLLSSAKTISPAGDWVSLKIPASKANELFDTTFTTFTHTETGTQSVQAMQFSVPSELTDVIEVVHPTTSFPNPFANLPVVKASFGSVSKSALPETNITSRAVPSSCASSVTPTCLQDLYGIPTAPATQSSNTLGVSGFIDQFAQEADLKNFLGQFRPDISSSTTFNLQTLDGGSNPQGANEAGIEANLDIQYTIGVATGVPTSFISVGDNFQDGNLEGFLDIINFLLDESNPPHVLTTSYGQNENTISRSLANNLCNAYMQLGARGTSILFASGDGGVSGSQSASCSKFVPTFPSGCPFMTSVGATTGISPETAASFSAGGFSNYFGVPSYQASVVSAYQKSLGSTDSGKFNASGRGYPDVSAQGQNVEIVSGGQTGTVAGTSCSSPIFASVIALVNDKLVAAGKSPLGFLNPFLYSTGASALNDITTGSNPGCKTNGFPAKTGWDPVTGLGTPNFAKLLTAVGL